MKRRLLLTMAPLAFAGAVRAATHPDEILKDPNLEARARGLSKQLRCLVCQNQSIDDSDAELARDLRRLVREHLLAGKSDQEILDYLTDRYGDFVLLKPPVKASTWGLWFGPLLAFLLAAGGLALYLRSRRPAPTDAGPLSTAELKRLRRLTTEAPSATPSKPRSRA